MDIKIKPESLQDTITEILREYGDVVFEATNEALGAAEKVLIKNLRALSPSVKKPSEGVRKKELCKKAGRAKGKKYKMARYVGNNVTVQGKSGEIPLSNILEYSSKSPHQGLIKKTHESSINEMAAAVVAELKKEV